MERIYVNKMPMIAKLLEDPSGGIALTAPRRMGKSMTLSTLKLIKLLGTEDLIKWLEQQELNQAAQVIREL